MHFKISTHERRAAISETGFGSNLPCCIKEFSDRLSKERETTFTRAKLQKWVKRIEYIYLDNLPVKFHISPQLFSGLWSNKWHLFYVAPRHFALFVNVLFIHRHTLLGTHVLSPGKRGEMKGFYSMVTPCQWNLMHWVSLSSLQPYNVKCYILKWRSLKIIEIKLDDWEGAPHVETAWQQIQPVRLQSPWLFLGNTLTPEF